MLPPRFAGPKAVNNSGGGGGGWSGGKLVAGSGPGMSSTHSIVGSTHGMKTGGGNFGGGDGSGGGREVAAPPTVQAPHHVAADRAAVLVGDIGRGLHARCRLHGQLMQRCAPAAHPSWGDCAAAIHLWCLVCVSAANVASAAAYLKRIKQT
eukprot:1154125-Pelagomonas_calceolata.AAC.5